MKKSSADTLHREPQHPVELEEEQLDEVAAGYELKNVQVTSSSVSGDADDRPTEEVAFYFQRATK